MNLSFAPLLRVRRDLYAMPRCMARFREYIRGYPPQGFSNRAGLALGL
jgi:hypothetical protein